MQRPSGRMGTATIPPPPKHSHRCLFRLWPQIKPSHHTNQPYSSTHISTSRKIWKLFCFILLRLDNQLPVYSSDLFTHIRKIWQTVLQLSGRPVTKWDLWNGWATQILPNTGPTGNPKISFAKVHVRSFQSMQPCRTCGYQHMHIFPIFFMSDHQKFVWTTQSTNWLVRWATQDFSLAAALIWPSIDEVILKKKANFATLTIVIIYSFSNVVS